MFLGLQPNLPLLGLAIASFAIALLTVAFLKQRFSQQFLDIPNDRSAHDRPTPRGGGLGFILAFALTSAIAPLIADPSTLGRFPTLTEIAQLWLILAPLAIVGILDDRLNLPAKWRYLVQLASASLAVAQFGAFPQPWLTRLGTPGEILAVLLTVVGFTAIVNFYNFMDGLDGLVAGVTAVQIAFLAVWFDLPLLWLLFAALLGFLWWNWSPAKIFMGDAGSTVLGATVAIALMNAPNDPIPSWAALTLTLPLTADTIYTLIRRAQRRENIFQAHRTHLFQRLYQSGWSHPRVAIAYIALTLLIGSSLSQFGWIASWLILIGAVGTIAIAELYLRQRWLNPESESMPSSQ